MTDPAAVRALAARYLPGSGPVRAVRAAGGGTTEVYRAARGGGVVFVRLAEHPGDSMAAEAWAHEEVRRRGGRVPEVLGVEPPGSPLGAAMVTGLVPGRALAGRRSAGGLAPVLCAAGRDLALFGSIPVEGFGFVLCDDRVPPLRGQLPDAASLLANQPPPARYAALIERELPLLAGDRPVLAHGDFDATHVLASGPRYGGIIDLGEIRGAPPLYDLGHWALHEAQLPVPTLGRLLNGYREVARLPPDHERRIALLGLLIGLRLQRRGVSGPYAAPIATGIERLAARLA